MSGAQRPSPAATSRTVSTPDLSRMFCVIGAWPTSSTSMRYGIDFATPTASLGPVSWNGVGQPATFNLTIPVSAALVGVDLFFQGVIVDLSLTSGIGIGLTEGLTGRIF